MPRARILPTALRPPSPGPAPSGRRAFLRAALGTAAALGAAGCARLGLGPPPASAASRTPLLVAAHSLLPAAAGLARAWDAAHRSSRLTVESEIGGPPRYTMPDRAYALADVGQLSGDGEEPGGLAPYVNIAPLVRQANFDLGRLLPSAVQAFAFGGDLFGLPLLCVPYVLMTNTTLLGSAGVAHPADQPWTLAQIESAVAAARASANIPASAQLISGSLWTDVRLWGAFVLGLGGALTGPGGVLDFRGAATVAATRRLVALATAANWVGLDGDPAAAGFVYGSFKGGTAETLFAIEPDFPAPGFPVGVIGPQNRFPLLPHDALIPAYQTSGLAVPKHSKQAEVAVEFLLWLYEDNQQRLLMSAGVPPIVTDRPALLTEWSHATPGGQDIASLTDPTHMVDVLALLPQGGYVASQDYRSRLQSALLSAAREPGGLAADLAQAQQSLQQLMAQESAFSTCALSNAPVKHCPRP